MVSYKLYLCAFFVVALQMVAVNANEKLMSYIVQELEKDAHTVREKLGSLKYFLKYKMTHAENHYHINMDKVIADTEKRIKSMRCDENTMDRVKTARQYGWGSFKQCVELTRAFADGEMVVYDTVVYLEGVLHLLANVTKRVAECRHSSLFKAMSCVVETIANHSDEYKEKCDAIVALFNRMDNITQQIHNKFGSCINNTEILVSIYVENIIVDNCEKQSFFKRLLDSIKSKFNNNQKFTLFEKPTEKKRQETPTEEYHQKTLSDEHHQNTLLDKHLQKTLSEEHQQKTLSGKITTSVGGLSESEETVTGSSLADRIALPSANVVLDVTDISAVYNSQQ